MNAFIWVTFIFLIHVLVVTSAVIMEEVEFLSSQLPSGQITLHGTIFMPSSSTNKIPAAVLVSGSEERCFLQDYPTIFGLNQ